MSGRFAGIDVGERRLHYALVDAGAWVSWVAPSGSPFPRWMEVGFGVYRALGRSKRTEVLEVYPHAAFRQLAGGRRLARKQSQVGRRQRADLLARAGLREGELAGGGLAPPPSHDVLDALAAALVALDRFRGRARRVGCGHDDSAIWLPGPPG